MFFSIVILAISLSLDALGVGVVYGFRRVKIPFASKLIICLFSVLYSGLAIIIGKSLSALVPQYAKLSGIVILILMGLWIIAQALYKNKSDFSDGKAEKSVITTSDDTGVRPFGHNKVNPPGEIPLHPVESIRQETRTLLKIAIKSLGITIHVFQNPMEFDIDKSGTINVSESFLLGFALSVDAIGVGIGSGMMGFDSVFIPSAIGICQLLFLYTGGFLGRKCIPFFKINEKLLAVLPGTLLILLALIRIF